MKKLVFFILLIASPAWAQTKLVPKSVTARADPCAPIGRSADGKLGYSMKCDNLPAPPPPPPQAQGAPPPPSPAATAARGRSRAASAAGAGSASKWNFRLVL